MMKGFAWFLPVVLVVAVGFAVAQDEKPKSVPQLHETAPELIVDLLADKSEVVLGDYIHFSVRILNATDRDVEITEPDFHYSSVMLLAKVELPQAADDTKEESGEKDGGDKEKAEEKPLTDKEKLDQLKQFEIGRHSQRSGTEGSTPKTFAKETSFPYFTLKARRSILYSLSIPSVKVGDYHFKAAYTNARVSPRRIESKDWVKVHVAPFNDATELVAEVVTNRGNMEIRFFPEHALNTVINFVNLARDKYYDGTEFYSVATGALIEGGAKDVFGGRGAAWQIKSEISEDLFHEKGTLTMAEGATAQESAGSQFRLCGKNVAKSMWDEGSEGVRYTIFGKAISGLDTVQALVSSQNKRDTEAFQKRLREINESSKPAEQKNQEREALLKTAGQPVDSLRIDQITISMKKLDNVAENK